MESKFTKRNFTADGHISNEERSGKFRTNAYFRRSKGLLNAAEVLHKIILAHVKVESIPTSPQGIRRHFPPLDSLYLRSR